MEILLNFDYHMQVALICKSCSAIYLKRGLKQRWNFLNNKRLYRLKQSNSPHIKSQNQTPWGSRYSIQYVKGSMKRYMLLHDLCWNYVFLQLSFLMTLKDVLKQDLTMFWTDLWYSILANTINISAISKYVVQSSAKLFKARFILISQKIFFLTRI